MSKNELMKQINIDKIALFLSNKYNKIFKDKNFTMNILKNEISRLLIGKNMKLFNFNESIKKIEKSILKRVSNYGEIKYEPIQMDKINNLLSYNNTITSQPNIISNKSGNNPIKNKLKEYAPKIQEEQKNPEHLKSQRIQSAFPKSNKLNLIINKKDLKDIPYPTEKMEKLREREKNRWAVQANKEFEEYLKEQDKLKKDNYEKKMKQRKFLEQQIKEKKEYEKKIKQEEKDIQPYFTSLKFKENNQNKGKEKLEENIRRPLSSKPLIKRRTEEIEYQKKIEEDLKKYQEQENVKKKNLRDKYKEIEKENYENALKKKKEKILEREIEKNEKNNINLFNKEDNRMKEIIRQKQIKIDELSKSNINQNIKHQMAINNYENQKYKREIEQEKKKYINEELVRKEKKKKIMNDFKKGLDEQIKEKEKIKKLKLMEKINENNDNLEIKNKIIEENNMRSKIKYQRINNYKKDLDEQIENNKKLKQNEQL